MEELDIEKYENSKELIKILNEKNKNGDLYYITILETQNKAKLKKYIEDIKKHFDIFIMYKTNIPETYVEIENYFIIGFHALIFYQKNNYDIRDIKILDYSKELFKIGKVFLEYSGQNTNDIDFLIELNIIPLLNRCDENMINYILKKAEKQRNFTNYLKYIEIFNKESCINTFAERLKRKMELELINFRQKIMIKNVRESFDSSYL